MKNPPASAGDRDSVPGLGGSHMLQLLKPAHSGTCAPQQEKPLQWEARAPQLECIPCLSQLEIKSWEQQRPSTAINKYSLSCWNFLVVQWLGHSMLPVQGIQVWSLVRELRSHMPCGMTKKKKKFKLFLHLNPNQFPCVSTQLLLAFGPGLQSSRASHCSLPCLYRQQAPFPASDSGSCTFTPWLAPFVDCVALGLVKYGERTLLSESRPSGVPWACGEAEKFMGKRPQRTHPTSIKLPI